MEAAGRGIYTGFRTERLSRGWSSEYVAERLGISLSGLYAIETGRRNPRHTTLLKMLELYGLDSGGIREMFRLKRGG